MLMTGPSFCGGWTSRAMLSSLSANTSVSTNNILPLWGSTAEGPGEAAATVQKTASDSSDRKRHRLGATCCTIITHTVHSINVQTPKFAADDRRATATSALDADLYCV